MEVETHQRITFPHKMQHRLRLADDYCSLNPLFFFTFTSKSPPLCAVTVSSIVHVFMYACKNIYMCACMCLCVFWCMHVCMQLCIYFCMFVYIFAKKHKIYPQACRHVFMYACKNECMCACMCLCVLMCACLYATVYVFLYVCTYFAKKHKVLPQLCKHFHAENDKLLPITVRHVWVTMYISLTIDDRYVYWVHLIFHSVYEMTS